MSLIKVNEQPSLNHSTDIYIYYIIYSYNDLK